MNTKENNKLIAEFMGYVNLTPTDKDFNIYEGTNKVIGKLIETNFEKRFHTDWNWLMEVVDKIYEMDLYYDKYIDYNSSMVSNGKITLGTRINRVYEQVVDFINWYNEQNK